VPEGWRIPKQESTSPWSGLNDATNFATGVTGYTNGRYNASAGYYPFSGYMSGASVITTSPTYTYYWSSHSNSMIYGTGLEIDNASTVNNVPDIPKSRGASVRCVVDTNYLQNMPGGGLFRK
jgi:uncharacterized protein (TIGR02145 family)